MEVIVSNVQCSLHKIARLNWYVFLNVPPFTLLPKHFVEVLKVKKDGYVYI